jgi:DNA-binding NtrC family response regulator
LHDRPEDIHILFRKFAADFANKYKTAPVQLDDEAKQLLINYPWPGNVRELKNIAEQISVLSTDKNITAKELSKFLQPYSSNRLPILASANGNSSEFANEREILYKLFFDMKKDVTELKRMFLDVLQNPNMVTQNQAFINELKESDSYRMKNNEIMQSASNMVIGNGSTGVQQAMPSSQPVIMNNDIHDHVEVEESLNIMDKEKELII